MAGKLKRALKTIEDHGGNDVSDTLHHAISALRSEVASITKAVNSYGGSRLNGIQRGANTIADDFQHQLPIVARQAGRQASAMGKAVRNDPIPTIVTLATIALLSSLLYRKN